MLLGIPAGQCRIFEGIAGKTKQVALFTLIMLAMSVIGLLYQSQYLPDLPFALFCGGSR